MAKNNTQNHPRIKKFLEIFSSNKDYFTDIESIIRELGICLKNITSLDIIFDTTLSVIFPSHSNFSGAIRNENNVITIYVNDEHSYGRKRFTMAHELSHYILHFNQIGDGIIDDTKNRSFLPEADEIQANRLAADILMPRDKIQEKISYYNSINPNLNTIPPLSKEFGVSEIAMEIRLGLR